jgi:hypothetical protein
MPRAEDNVGLPRAEYNVLHNSRGRKTRPHRSAARLHAVEAGTSCSSSPSSRPASCVGRKTPPRRSTRENRLRAVKASVAAQPVPLLVSSRPAQSIPSSRCPNHPTTFHPLRCWAMERRRRHAMAMWRRRGGPRRPSYPDFDFGGPSQCGIGLKI